MVVGQQCPAISGLTFVKGEPIVIGESADPAVKRVIVLEIWATWCPPCRDSIPHLSKLQQQYKDQHVYVVGVTQEDDAKKVERFVSAQGASMDYTVAMDEQGSVQELMTKAGAKGIPHAFIIDVNNAITYSGHPRDPGFEVALNKAAAAAAPKREPEALPLITESKEELMSRSIKELKGMLSERGVSMAGLAEKADLVGKIMEACSTVTYYK